MSQTTNEGVHRPRPPIPTRPDPRTAPLSFIQRQVWLVDQLTPGNPAYNLPRGLRLRGPLDQAALASAFDLVIRRHEILRTTFVAEGGGPRQLIHPDLAIRIAVTSLEHVPMEERERELEALATQESLRPFDLSCLPLVRVTLFRLGTEEHVLVVNVHHIVVDGLSLDLLLDEVGAAYRAYTSGAEPALPALPLQYGDFAQWEREQWADDAAHATEIEYWRTTLAGPLPVLELPTDRPRPPVESWRGSNLFFRLPPEVGSGVRMLARRERCTGFMVLLAAFEVLLSRHAETADLVIGTPLGARPREELQPLIGNFLTMVGLRCSLSGRPTFLDLLHRGRDATLEALMNAVPLTIVMRQLAIERVAGRNPVFQVLIEMLRTPATQLGDLDVTPFDFDLGFAQFDLSLHIHDEGEGYLARLEYNTDLFDRATVARIAAAFLEVVRHAVTHPEQPADDIPILPEEERQRILAASTGPEVEVVDQPVPALVDAQAARTPERLAVRSGGAALTYAELTARVDRVAQLLRARGAGRAQRIGVCLERGGDLIATLLGVLKTGAAYVPLDPSYPAPRLRFMATDAQLSLLVSTAPLAGWCELPRERQLLLDVDAGTAGPGAERARNGAPERPAATDPAYVIYTSGSTGTPKGVVIPHGAVVNLLAGMAREPGIAAHDILLAVTTVCFDIAVLELFLPLCVGASVVVAARDDVRDGEALRSLLDQEEVTIMQATPVTWRLLLEAGWQGRSPFKALVGGEALPRDLVEALHARGAEVWNMYGPTETTIWSTCARIDDLSTGITIGRPIANTTVRVLDARRRPRPIGVPGELHIGGAGLAIGYWDRPELTSERFVPDPDGAAGARLYRTGDRVRLRGDGRLEHLGRLDDQVKLRGFRIELGEIEAHLTRHPGIREAAAVVRTDPPGDPRLVAYLVGEPGGTVGTEPVRDRLRAELPEFMIPAEYVVLEALPRTANGKVDHRALPAPARDRTPRGSPAAPRTSTEAMVLEIFRDVLGRSTIGMHDNFFDLGGDSLMAARLVLRLRAASECDVPLRRLFERQTPAGLAEAIESLTLVAAPERSGAAGRRVEIEL